MSIDLEHAESIWSLARMQLKLVVNSWHKKKKCRKNIKLYKKIILNFILKVKLLFEMISHKVHWIKSSPAF